MRKKSRKAEIFRKKRKIWQPCWRQLFYEYKQYSLVKVNFEDMSPPFSGASTSVGLIPRENYSEEAEDQRQCVTTSTSGQSASITDSLLDMSTVLPMLFTLCYPIASIFRWRYRS